MKRLAGKIAIVTGSSSGIGKAIALTFGKEGAAVVIAARRKDLCEKTVAQIRKEGGDAMAIQTDVTDEAQVERLITETVKRYGRLDLLVNNAGIGGGGRIESTIINMSSVAGVQAWAGTGTYSASKHAILALTKSLADEGRAYKIKVSAISPGGVADELVDASREEILRSEQISPYDIAETAVYLATLGPYAVVHQIIVDRLGADW